MTRRVIEIGVAALLYAGALFAAFAGGITTELICSGESSGCLHHSLFDAQEAVVYVGLAPATVFAIAVLKKWRRAAWVSLVVGLVVYLAWGVLNDAAVHGWNDLQLFSL